MSKNDWRVLLTAPTLTREALRDAYRIALLESGAVKKMKTKGARIKDFEARAKAEPDSVQSEPELGRYLAVNPMADETSLLKRLGIDARACTKVDLFWRQKDDVLFVQVQGRSYSADRKPGYYARKAPSGYLNIVAVISDDLVTSRTVLRVLGELANRRVAVRTLRDTLQPI